MTAIVSLLFIAKIPIDWRLKMIDQLIVKLQNFPYCLFFLVTIIILVNSQAPLQKKEWLPILFSWVLHPLINEKFICQWALYLRMLALLHSAIDKREYEKYLFLPLFGNTENHLWQCTHPGLICRSEKAKGQLCFIFRVALYNILQNALGKRIASKHLCNQCNY